MEETRNVTFKDALQNVDIDGYVAEQAAKLIYEQGKEDAHMDNNKAAKNGLLIGFGAGVVLCGFLIYNRAQKKKAAKKEEETKTE